MKLSGSPAAAVLSFAQPALPMPPSEQTDIPDSDSLGIPQNFIAIATLDQFLTADQCETREIIRHLPTRKYCNTVFFLQQKTRLILADLEEERERSPLPSHLEISFKKVLSIK